MRRWEKLVLYASFGWLTLLLAVLVYLAFSIVFHHVPDGFIFAAVAGAGWSIGALVMIVSELCLERRTQGRN
jgi:zinc transporter ZupT